jgi:hypothetical protein
MGYTHVIKIPTDVMESLVLPEMAPRQIAPAPDARAGDHAYAPAAAADAV